MKTSEKDTILVVGVILAFLFFTYLLPSLEKQFNKDKEQFKENMEIISKDTNINKFDLKQCSKSCCLHTQWTVPHLKGKEVPKGYTGSNFMCANGSGGGCLCVKNKDLEYLEGRAFNQPKCESK